ncbi:endoribonuclease YbeY [Polynucleobacter sp. SHI8]|uniref:rRNA maturation RNase YbeY n=1 Tax=unclassified Polynucleobacter TaxID=2640945 RepID=UPI00249111BC|nr:MULTISPECIES: rRNA maturation RNase YbeY [unclassified Polynucleobacter]BDW12069.1 endoribonuclease YbeY [Polynucleobacter sp. SHI2]BDW14517.1 endoribonuclease YbeY [Polynucleobacter sp. SHI8]
MTSQIKRKVSFQLGLELQFASDALESKWAEIFSVKKIRPWVKAALQQDSLILIRLVGLAESKRLNHQYREQDHSTNILTFTLTEDIPSSKLTADLVLCMPIIEKEAKKQGKTIENHFAHLIVHGVLHAQGFDHEDEIDALAMESLEIAILKRLKIQNPYI